MASEKRDIPQHIKRSIDEYRFFLGFKSLWGYLPNYAGEDYQKVTRRRRQNREAQRRRRLRIKEATDGTQSR